MRQTPTSSHRRSGGFTLVELAVVIVILGILLTLVGLTYSGVQARNRNGQRQKDVNLLQTELETYYAQSPNGQYPTLGQINNPVWRAKNLPKLAASAIADPSWSAKNTACTVDSQAVLSAKPATGCYAYQVTDTSGDACDNNASPCAHYTLTATLEGNQPTYVKSSLN